MPYDRKFVTYRLDIDGLRAVAVLLVLIFHAFPPYAPGGFIGVDVFFVISGYLITSLIVHSKEDKRFKLIDFYLRRIKRIFPALVLVLISAYTIGWFTLLPDEMAQLGRHIFGAATFTSNFILWKESGYFDNSAATKPLLHLWSLSIEEQFYVVWPLLVLIALRFRFGLHVIVLGLGITSIGTHIYVARSNPTAAFYLPFSRFWELLSGASILLLLRNRHCLQLLRSTTFRTCISILGISLILGSALWFSRTFSETAAWMIIPVVGALLVIVAGSDSWTNRVLLGNRAAVWVGLISYPLYLWHWLFLSFLRILYGQTPDTSVRIYAILLSFFLAALTYLLVEKKIRRLQHTGYVSMGLCVCLFGIGMLGYHANYDQGLAVRFSPEMSRNHRQLIRTRAKSSVCKSFVGPTEAAFTYCQLNDVKGRETIALIGDSHAQTLYPGFAKLAAAAGKNTILLGTGGCPPFLGVATGRNPVSRSECNTATNEILKIILQLPTVEHVVIATRGPVYFTGSGFGEIDKAFSPHLSPIYPMFNGMSESELFRVGLQRTVDVLTGAGKTVSYVIENPELGFDVRRCIGRPIRLPWFKCYTEKRMVLQRQARYREIVHSVKGATIFDPIPAFCPQDLCNIQNQGVLLYADDDHLSTYGSLFLAQTVLKRLFE